MKINFKKVSAIAASALMVGLTMGTAAAANYPAPFVSGGVASVAVVYGTGAGVSSLDLVQAGNIQSNLQSYMAASDGSTTTTGGSAWRVATGSDALEIGETIKDVEGYIGSEDFSLLTDESISNEKGDAEYEQFLYFERDATQNSTSVIYTEDDDDNIGLFLKFVSGTTIAKYVMDFSVNLKSDIETDGELSDIEDKSITFLGKTYTIVDATNGTSGAELTLMSGALGGTVANGEEITVGDYKVSVVVSSSTSAKFTVNGVTIDKMAKGDMEKLSDGNYLAVTDITYEGYAGGIQQATFYIGADKIEWKNGQKMVVNGETINDAAVTITSTNTTDYTISEISVNMTAEDDLYVPVGGKLSQASDLDEPAVLLTQNWDIEFKGLEAVEYEDLSLKVSESDQQYTLKFDNYDGCEVDLPLLYTNASGVYGGDDADKRLVLDPDGSQLGGNITKKDYFIINTADPVTASNDAKTIVIRYDNSDETDSTDPKAYFTVNPGECEVKETMNVDSTGTFTLKIAGGTFTFKNASTAINDDFDIYLSGAGDYSDGSGGNLTASTYIRTHYNTLINITDLNATDPDGERDATTEALANAFSASWIVNVTSDDTNRDGDHFTLPVNGQVFYVTLANTSTDASATFTGTGSWLTDPDNSDVQKYVTKFGTDITKTDPSDSPASIEVKIPKNIVSPLVYVTTGDVTVTSTTGSSTQLGDVLVKDSEVSSVSSKNLIVVGGSCINSAAAKLLGSAACSASFTEKTGVGSGQFLIQSFGDAYTTGKIALLVAGYEAADTVNAATYLRTKTVDTTAGKKYKGTSATTAELVTTSE